jgi:two-component system sensor histidine kinase BaeS
MAARMKLATQLSLLLVGALLIAILAMGAFFAFNLERGFVAYINAEQLRQLDVIAARAQRIADRDGSLEPLLRDRRYWGRLVREVEEGLDPREPDFGPQGPPPREAEGRGPPGGPPFRRERPPFGDGGPPPKGPPQGELRGRRGFFILDAQREPPRGEPPLPVPRSQPPVERAIRAGDRVVGYVVHYPYEHVIRAEDAAFLRSQFLGVGVVALALLAFGVIAAPLAARRWTRPLRAIGQATGRIAHGDLGAQVAAGGATEIATLAEDVNAMAASLSRLDESRKQWIAQSAHELRTPLMVLRGEIEALQDGVRPTDARALASLADEVAHLAKLVEDLHLVAVADMGALHCRLEPVDPRASVERAIERFAERARTRRIALSASLPDSPVSIEADETRLAQLLDNLIENSLRYTDAPGRTEVSLATEGGLVRLRVEDTAPGVAAGECARLFEPLHRADVARSRREGGSGLGLSVCRAIARAHGATIIAQPSRLGGLAVDVRFPRAP